MASGIVKRESVGRTWKFASNRAGLRGPPGKLSCTQPECTCGRVGSLPPTCQCLYLPWTEELASLFFESLSAAPGFTEPSGRGDRDGRDLHFRDSIVGLDADFLRSRRREVDDTALYVGSPGRGW